MLETGASPPMRIHRHLHTTQCLLANSVNCRALPGKPETIPLVIGDDMLRELRLGSSTPSYNVVMDLSKP